MGEHVRFYEDVVEGDVAPSITKELTRTDLVMYAGASGDFNPLHHDEVAARASGLPSVFGHGMYTSGLLATAITHYVGIGNLRSYKVRFTKQTWPGEVVSTSIRVEGKRVVGNDHLVDLACAVANADGETKIVGAAVAALPSRG